MPTGELPKLRFEMEATPATGVGQPLLLRFRLINESSRRVCVLRWYTPLEGLRGRILRVTREGAEIPYRGMMVKRGRPAREDYACLAPGDTASHEMDLAGSYDLSVAGRYEARFVGRIHDFSWDESKVPRAAHDHRSCPVDALPAPLTFERRPQ